MVGGCLAGVGLAGAEQWCLPRKGGVRWSGWVVVVVVVVVAWVGLCRWFDWAGGGGPVRVECKGGVGSFW